MKKLLFSVIVLIGLTSIKSNAAGLPPFPVSEFSAIDTALLNSPKLGVTGLFQTGATVLIAPGGGVVTHSVRMKVKIRTSKLFKPVAKHVFTMPFVSVSVERSGIGVVMRCALPLDKMALFQGGDKKNLPRNLEFELSRNLQIRNDAAWFVASTAFSENDGSCTTDYLDPNRIETPTNADIKKGDIIKLRFGAGSSFHEITSVLE